MSDWIYEVFAMGNPEVLQKIPEQHRKPFVMNVFQLFQVELAEKFPKMEETLEDRKEAMDRAIETTINNFRLEGRLS